MYRNLHLNELQPRNNFKPKELMFIIKFDNKFSRKKAFAADLNEFQNRLFLTSIFPGSSILNNCDKRY